MQLLLVLLNVQPWRQVDAAEKAAAAVTSFVNEDPQSEKNSPNILNCRQKLNICN